MRYTLAAALALLLPVTASAQVLYGPAAITGGTINGATISNSTISGTTVSSASVALTGATATLPTNGLFISTANEAGNALPSIGMTAKDGSKVLQFLSSSEAGQSPTDTIGLGYGALANWNAAGSNGPEIAIGQYALGSVTTGDHNIALGMQAMHYNLTGAHNTALGIDSMATATAPGSTVAIGEHSLTYATAPGNGVFIGVGAGFYLGASSGDTAVGWQSMQGQVANSGTGTTGGNTAVGYSSLMNIGTTGAFNTAIGSSALLAVGNANSNTALGYQAGVAVSTGANNILLGALTATALTTGSNNVNVGGSVVNGSSGSSVCIGLQTKCGGNDVAVGTAALSATNNNNKGNSAFGTFALHAVTSGQSNVGLGYTAGQNLTSGSNNTLVGNVAGGTTLLTGSNNILLGSGVDTLASGTSNEINIGGLIFYNNASVAAPAVSACGTSPTIDSRANNRSGTVTVGTATPTSCTITLAGSGYSTWNHCRVTSQAVNASFAYTYTLTVLTVTGSALAGKVDYDCDGV
jgi:hypothetical protein